MPSWSDINPKAIAAQLPIVWSFKYDRLTRRFTCRLVGDRIAQFFGNNLRGASLAEVQPPEAFDPVNAMLLRVVQEPTVYRGGGRVFQQLDHFTSGERIILPLAADGITGDEVFGATEYDSPHIYPGAPGRTVSENENWFPLNSFTTRPAKTAE